MNEIIPLIDWNQVYSSKYISAIIDRDIDCHEPILRNIFIQYNSCTSVKLILSVSPMNDDSSQDNNHADDIQDESSIKRYINYSFILDIQARIISEEVKDPITSDLLSCIVHYDRLGVHMTMHILPHELNTLCLEEIKLLDFLFSQYSYYDNKQHLINERRKYDNYIPRLNNPRNANAMAKGFETSGKVLRSTLKGKMSHILLSLSWCELIS